MIFRSFAQARLTGEAIETEQANIAEARAKDLVRRRPIPAENLSLLSMAAYLAGDEATGQQALFLSAMRGWREPFTQQMMVAAAIENGEWSVAADRVYALWATGFYGEGVPALTRTVLASPQGRATFAEHLRSDRHWTANFLAWAGENLQPDALAELSDATASPGARLDCAALSARSRRLVETGNADAALELWTGTCAKGRPQQPNRFAFTAPSDQKGPFEWSYPGAAGLQRTFETSGENISLAYRNDDPLKQPLGQKFARLSPGEYTLRLTTDPPLSARPGTLVVRVQCLGGPGTISRTLRDQTNRLAIPADCPIQQLTLFASRGSGKVLGLSVE